jgi:gamma-glutamyltranspeptidase/glutathione hydrolase
MLLTLETAPAAAPPADALHRFLEASRRAHVERRFSVVDPERLAPEEHAARRARWLDSAFWLRVPIDPEHATPFATLHAPAAGAAQESEHTTHVSVADADGMVVSLTTTLSASFGSKIVAAGTGIVLNNAVASFSASGDNQPEPGRRTTSSMAPTLVLRGDQVNAVLGTPGGDTIPSTLAQIVRGLVIDGLTLDRAVDARRWHQGYDPDRARYEPAPPLDPALLESLRRRGHHPQPFRRPIGAANCILVGPDGASGYADARELGSVAVPSGPP